MTPRTDRSAPTLAILALALLVTASACDDSDGPLELQYWAADSVPSPNRVRLVGADRSGQMLRIEVVVDGPTTSADLSTFDFGVRIGDGTLVEYVPSSEQLGTALDPSGCVDVQLLATPVGDDLAVTVAKIGCAGNAIGSGASTLMSFEVRVLREGATTVRLGSVPANDPPVALDSTPSEVGSIVFDPAPITVFGL